MTWDPLWLSLRVAAMATTLTLICGIGLAALLSWRRMPVRELIDAFISLPLVLPPTVLGYYLLGFLGKNSALGGAILRATGWELTFSVTGCVIAAAVGSLPLVYKAARTAIDGVDHRLVQAARTLGAGRLRAFFTVTMPLAGPGVIAGLMMGFARAQGDFGATLMIAGNIPGETQTGSLYIYDMVWAGNRDRAAAMVLVMTSISVGLLFAANLLLRRLRDRDHG